MRVSPRVSWDNSTYAPRKPSLRQAPLSVIRAVRLRLEGTTVSCVVEAGLRHARSARPTRVPDLSGESTKHSQPPLIPGVSSGVEQTIAVIPRRRCSEPVLSSIVRRNGRVVRDPSRVVVDVL